MESTAVMVTKLGPASLAAIVINAEIVPEHEDTALGNVRATISRKFCTASTERFWTTLPSTRPVRMSKGAEQMTHAASDVLELVSNTRVGTAAIGSATERLHGLFVDTDHPRVVWRL